MVSKLRGSIACIAALALFGAPLAAQDKEAPAAQDKEAPAKTKAPAEPVPEKPAPEKPAAAAETRDPTRVDGEWARLAEGDGGAEGGPRVRAPAPAPLPTIALRGRILAKNKAPAALLEIGGALSVVKVGAELSLGIAPPQAPRRAGAAAQNPAIARAVRQARGRRGRTNPRAPTRAARPASVQGAPRTLTILSITEAEVRVQVGPDKRVLVLR